MFQSTVSLHTSWDIHGCHAASGGSAHSDELIDDGVAVRPSALAPALLSPPPLPPPLPPRFVPKSSDCAAAALLHRARCSGSNLHGDREQHRCQTYASSVPHRECRVWMLGLRKDTPRSLLCARYLPTLLTAALSAAADAPGKAAMSACWPLKRRCLRFAGAAVSCEHVSTRSTAASGCLWPVRLAATCCCCRYLILEISLCSREGGSTILTRSTRPDSKCINPRQQKRDAAVSEKVQWIRGASLK